MNEATTWYIIKTNTGICEIVTAGEANTLEPKEQWGPFSSQGDAIAKRVGLIRAGKCQPA
ncbi:MAG: hypothetical protein AAFR26_05355 [Cyanobacteria bacterium J06626_4]